jgi:antitoxin CptB
MGGNNSDAIETRRKRLRFRCWHRGMKEMDLLLGPFADQHIAAMSGGDLDQLEALLACPDPDLYNWITLQHEIPASMRSPVLDRIIRFHNGS